ncbi:MAG: AzlC family ABC transporter permease [Dermatophilaceae bacterium]
MSEATTLPAERRRAVLRQSWSVGIATGLYGVSFGALSVAAGLSIWQTQALSALMFTGGSQFAFIGIVATGGLSAAPAAIATATMLSIRNGLYALSTRRFLAPTDGHLHPVRKVAAAHLTIDESSAVGLAQAEPEAARLGFWHTGVAVFLFWNLMTLVGALAGSVMGDPATYGLDGAAVAAFLALLWPRLQSADGRLTAAVAAVLALVAVPFVPAGVPVLIAALAAVAIGVRVGTRGAKAPPPDPRTDGDVIP